MQVATMAELKKAVQAGEAEIVVTDEALTRRVRMWTVLRTVANVAVVVVLVRFYKIAGADALGLKLVRRSR